MAKIKIYGYVMFKVPKGWIYKPGQWIETYVKDIRIDSSNIKQYKIHLGSNIDVWVDGNSPTLMNVKKYKREQRLKKLLD